MSNPAVNLTTPMTNKEHVLIVDDSPVNQVLLTNFLEKQGYCVSAFSNGLDVLACLESGELAPPDLILLDIIMPDMDGYTLCQRLKDNSAYHHIPVIFISSLDDSCDKVRGFEVGGVDYVTKPFHAGEVAARIQTHMKLRRLQKQLAEKNSQLLEEKLRSDALLLNVLPARVAEALIKNGSYPPQLYPDVTVCFVDIVSFTEASSLLSPDVIVHELNELFSAFDAITDAYDCERIKTVGDAYICTCGVPDPNPDHTRNIANAALDMMHFLEERNASYSLQWLVRMGIHTGEVVGGIVGTRKYLYDIFGDTVNIASRLESLSSPMKINVSHQVYRSLCNDFRFSRPCKIKMKGKGIRSTYCLEGRLQS